MERMKQTVLFCKNNSPGSISGDRHGDGGGEGNKCIKTRGKNEGKNAHNAPYYSRDSRGERRDERPARSSHGCLLRCYCSVVVFVKNEDV